MRRLPKRIRRKITMSVMSLLALFLFVRLLSQEEPTIVQYESIRAHSYWEACELIGDQGVDIRVCVDDAIEATGQEPGSFQGIAQVPVYR